jgi:hypothetical protein
MIATFAVAAGFFVVFQLLTLNQTKSIRRALESIPDADS